MARNKIEYSLPPDDFKISEKPTTKYSMPPDHFQIQEESIDRANAIKSQHPYLYKIAEMISQHPDLNKWVNKAGKDVGKHIVNPIQQAGLPIAAEHTLALPRGIATLATGYDPHASTQGVNPYVAEGMKGAGQALSALGGGKILQQIPKAFAANTTRKLEEALRNHADTEYNLKQQKAQASHEFGTSNPHRLELMNQDKAKALQEAIERMNQMPQSRGGPHQPGELMEQNANEAVSKARGAIQEYGGEGLNFPKRISDEFMRELRGEKNPETGRREYGFMQAIGNRYNTLSNKMRTDPNGVVIKETPNLVKLAADVKKQLPELSDPVQQQITQKWADELTTHKKINGADFLESYRGAKQELSKINDKYYGASITEQRALRPEKKQLKQQLITMKKIMDEQLGGQYLAELKNIDKQYATYVSPLAKNPIYQALKKGNAPSNTLQALSLETQGNPTLRMIFDKNPELQRLLFGEQFAKKPEKLLEKNEVIDELTTKNPKIHELRQNLHDVQQALEAKLQQATEQKEFEKLSHDIPELKRQIKRADEMSSNINKSLSAKNLSKEKIAELKHSKAKWDKRLAGLGKVLSLHSYIQWIKPFQL